MRRRTITAALAATLSLTAAAPAAADSISYLREGNIFLTEPDGSRQVQVTTTGIYSYASQADDGTLIALTGERLHKLSRDGKVLADFDTPVSDGPKKGPNENYFMGPYEPEISPDGSKVTYSYAWHHERYDHTCKCVRYGTDSGTAITHPDRQTGWEEFGGPLTGWMFASWMSNDTILRSYAGRAFAQEAVVNRVGPGKGDDDMTSWLDSTFDMDEVFQLRDGEMTRAGDKVAFVSYDVGHHGQSYRSSFNRIRVYRMTGPPPARPEACWWIDGVDEPDTMAGPSFAPDGGRLAYQYRGAIMIADVPDFSGGCQTPGEPRELLAGALPDWGPADVPAPVASGQAGAGGAGAGAGGAKPGTDGNAKPDAKGPLAVRVARTPLRAALRRGLSVSLTAPAAGDLQVTARRGGKRVARGARRVDAAGPQTLRVRFTPAGKRALRRVRTTALKVTVTFVPRKGAAVRQTLTTTLAR